MGRCSLHKPGRYKVLDGKPDWRDGITSKEKMIKKYSLLLFVIMVMFTIQANADEYKGRLGEGGGDYSIGQGSWRYESGKIIVYGGEFDALYYMVFSEAPWGSFDAYDYSPDSPDHPDGGFELINNKKSVFFPFKKERLLILMIS